MPGASPSPAKGRYRTLFIQDEEPVGPTASRGATMKSSHKRDVTAPFPSTSSLSDTYLQRCRQRKHFVAETLQLGGDGGMSRRLALVSVTPCVLPGQSSC